MSRAGDRSGSGHDLKAVLDALRQAVDAGAELARSQFAGRSFDVRLKPDGTPVTSTDVEVERRMGAVLAESLPDLPIAGEEKTGAAGSEPGTYIALDPIDGTSNFLRGVPFFGLTALYVESGAPAVGVVADPMHERTLWAVRGAGAFQDGERLTVRDGATRLEGATISLATETLAPTFRDRFLPEVLRRVDRQQALRSVALEIVGLAAGWIDAAMFDEVFVWDFGAAALILEEAGGRWSDIEGERPSVGDAWALYSFAGAVTPELHAELMELIRRTFPPAAG